MADCVGRCCPSLINVPQQKADSGAVLRQYQAVLETAEQVYDSDTLSYIVIKIAAFEDSGEVWPEIFITDEGVFTRFTLRVAGINTQERPPKDVAGRHTAF